ncbi:MAG: hypothetical protein GX074_00855, partial [Erysipelothrix sp.]|nr:hypothetical protein [Erysipelothrix sp.]
MFKKKNILKILLAFLLLFISPLSALAEGPPPLTGIVVEIDDKNIIVDMYDYSVAFALRTESPLYNYLISDGGIRVVGYESNEKYMDSYDYAVSFAIYGASGAIINTEALAMEDIRDYFVFKGFDDIGDPILVPLFESEALRVKLEHIKTLIEGNYSTDSWSNLQTVVSIATVIYEDENSINDDYKNAVIDLDGAINALQFSKTLTEEKFYTLVQEDYLYDEAVIKFRLNEDGEDEIIGLFLTTDVNQIINLAEDLFASVLPEAGVTGITINGEYYEIKEENIVQIAKAVLDAMEASPSNPDSFHGVSVSFMGTIGYEGYELIDKEFISYFYVAEVFAEEIQAAIDELPEVDEVSLEDKGKIVSVREKLDEAIVIHPDFGVHFANEIENLDKLENKIADLEAEDEAAERIAEEFKITHAGVLYKEVENILIADKAALNIALFEYDGLSDLVQSKLAVEISLLDELLIQINSLEDQVDNVKTSITTLPKLEKLTLEDKSVVVAVRTAYDLLTSEQQGLIDNYEYLIKTEAKIVELEDDLSATNEANTYRLIHEDILGRLVEDILIADKDAVTTALTDYDELSELAQSKLSNENSLLGELLIKIVGLEEEVEVVKSTIATLPNLDELTLDDKVSVVSSREAYKLLTSEQQELIDNYDELISAEARIVDLEAEKNAEQYRNTHADILVKEVNDVLIADKDAVTTALTDYDELSDLEQSKLSNENSLLGELLIKIKGLENQVEQVEYMIHVLPDLLELDLGDKSFVEAAREAYELLTSEQQGLIDNYDDLLVSEARIVELEAEGEAEQFRNKHLGILSKNTSNVLIVDKDAVNAALLDYEELSTLVQSNLTVEMTLLDELLTQIESLEDEVTEINVSITKLLKLEELTLDDKPTVDAIRDTYDLLTPEQQGLIDNYSALETAESKIMSLLVEQAKNELAKIAGDKTLELNEIPQADPSFYVETRTLTVTIQDKNASLLSIHNTGVISLLGEVESVRGYSLGEIERDFYDV